MKRLLFILCLLPLISCASTDPVWLTIDLGQKKVISTNVIAIRETVPVRLVNIGQAAPSNLVLRITDNIGTTYALTTGFATSAPAAVAQYGRTSIYNVAVGSVDLNTSEFVAFFTNRVPAFARPFTLGLWDVGRARLLVTDNITIKNNPYQPGQPGPSPVGTYYLALHPLSEDPQVGYVPQYIGGGLWAAVEPTNMISGGGGGIWGNIVGTIANQGDLWQNFQWVFQSLENHSNELSNVWNFAESESDDRIAADAALSNAAGTASGQIATLETNAVLKTGSTMTAALTSTAFHVGSKLAIYGTGTDSFIHYLGFGKLSFLNPQGNTNFQLEAGVARVNGLEASANATVLGHAILNTLSVTGGASIVGYATNNQWNASVAGASNLAASVLAVANAAMPVTGGTFTGITRIGSNITATTDGVIGNTAYNIDFKNGQISGGLPWTILTDPPMSSYVTGTEVFDLSVPRQWTGLGAGGPQAYFLVVNKPGGSTTGTVAILVGSSAVDALLDVPYGVTNAPSVLYSQPGLSWTARTNLPDSLFPSIAAFMPGAAISNQFYQASNPSGYVSEASATGFVRVVGENTLTGPMWFGVQGEQGITTNGGYDLLFRTDFGIRPYNGTRRYTFTSTGLVAIAYYGSAAGLTDFPAYLATNGAWNSQLVGLATGTPIYSVAGLATGTPIYSIAGLATGTPIYSVAGLATGTPIYSIAGLATGTPIYSVDGLATGTPLYVEAGTGTLVAASIASFMPGSVISNTFYPASNPSGYVSSASGWSGIAATQAVNIGYNNLINLKDIVFNGGARIIDYDDADGLVISGEVTFADVPIIPGYATTAALASATANMATSGQWAASVVGASNLALSVGAGATSLTLSAWATASNALTAANGVGLVTTNLHLAQGVILTGAVNGVVSVGLVATNAAAGVVAVGAVASNAYPIAGFATGVAALVNSTLTTNIPNWTTITASQAARMNGHGISNANYYSFASSATFTNMPQLSWGTSNGIPVWKTAFDTMQVPFGPWNFSPSLYLTYTEYTAQLPVAGTVTQNQIGTVGHIRYNSTNIMFALGGTNWFRVTGVLNPW